MSWLENIGKSLPIKEMYDDLARPALRELGDLAEKTVKAGRCVIAPIDYLATQQDRFQNYLKRVDSKVPENQQVEANPHIAGPVLSALRYVEEDSIITEMFLNLLARAIDKERVHEAHPAFTSIINQLSPDEANILYYCSHKTYVLKQQSKYNPSSSTFNGRKTIKNEFPITQLIYPEQFYMYFDHLHSLNLAGIWQHGNQEPTMSNDGNQTGTIITSLTRLTELGQLFVKACIPVDMTAYYKE